MDKPILLTRRQSVKRIRSETGECAGVPTYCCGDSPTYSGRLRQPDFPLPCLLVSFATDLI